ncbi:dihydroneopterin aldolase [uncultured Erythrobacter sp.]|uniref:dihydroneopterin aldolase n=1 Tax=uncultured Erythrobacter sp. TaxID=263913 RepID=UPI00262AF96A|nr:dihydroneopterin aldolase [uncultured Erythrobacter sp.]
MTDTVCRTHVRVRDYPVLADIGINPDEVGRRQPLVVSVEVEVVAPAITEIGETVDYRRIVAAIDELALIHIPLIETFAHQLAEKCLAMGDVAAAEISIDKPFAITRGMAGTKVTLSRD